MSTPAPLCPRFTESWLNEAAGREHIVLGRRLRPFCLWHRFLLEAVQSPFARVGAVPRHADLETAVRICCARYRDPLARILPGAPRGRLARWRLTLRGTWTTARYPLPQALLAFAAYVRDYQAAPEFWQQSERGAGRSGGQLPDTLALAAQLLAGGVFGADNEAGVWEMPLGRAHWYAAAFAKIEGADLRLRTESDRLFDDLRQLKARFAARRLIPPVSPNHPTPL